MGKKLAPPKEPIGIVPDSEKPAKNAPPPGSMTFEMDDLDSGADSGEEPKITTSDQRRGIVISKETMEHPAEEPEVPPEEPPEEPSGEPEFDRQHYEGRISDLQRGYQEEHQKRLKLEGMLSEVARRQTEMEQRSRARPPVSPEQDWQDFSQRGPRQYLDGYLQEALGPVLWGMANKLQEVEGRVELAPQEERYRESLEEVFQENPELRDTTDPRLRKLAVGIAREKEKIKGLLEASKEQVAKIQRKRDRDLLASKTTVANPSNARVETGDDWNPAWVEQKGGDEKIEDWFRRRKLIDE